ncbi:MAG: Clp protease N-terminal domain-containing protein [Armatimonadota bacterium]|nr:Clp protease N-terminal domain-containing protein [Armatimonadota bacterium]
MPWRFWTKHCRERVGRRDPLLRVLEGWTQKMPLRFTQSADRAVFFSIVEANRARQRSIRPEHLLLGLLADTNGPVAELLTRLGVSVAQVRRAAKRAALTDEGEEQLGEVSLDPRTELVVSLAREEARRLGYRHVGPEDLLAGLIREGESAAAKILVEAGVSLESISGEARRRAGNTPPLPLRIDWAWHRLRDRARQVILRADREAARRGDLVVTPEHLLLALALEEDSLAVRVLLAQGVAPVRVREAMEAQLSPVLDEKGSQPRAMDPRSDEVLHRALEEAAQSGERRVGTEHLLLSIAEEPSGSAAKVLATLGVTPEAIRRGVQHCLGEQGSLRAVIEQRLRSALTQRAS